MNKIDNWLESSKNIKIGLTRTEEEIIRFTTGCDLLDMVLGGAKDKFGFPAGKFLNVVGDKSAGKSLLCMNILAEAHQKYGAQLKYIVDDCESGNTFNSEEMFDFSLHGHVVQSDTVEKAFYNISKFCETIGKDDCGIYVLDSLDALTSHEEEERAEARLKAFDEEKEFDKGSYGMTKQKFLSNTFFPQLASLIEAKNVLVIIVSQVRENIAMFSFEKYVRAGGKALDFYATGVLWLATQKKITMKDRTIGTIIKAKTTKLKAPRPFRECCFSLLFDFGIDNVGSNLDYLLDLRTEQGELKSKREAIMWNEQVLSREKMLQYIENEGLEQKLREDAIAKWEGEEAAVATTRKKRYGTQPVTEPIAPIIKNKPGPKMRPKTLD